MNGKEWRHEFLLMRVLRILLVIIAFSIILWVFYNLSSGPTCRPMLFPSLGWFLFGLFILVWFLSWIFRASRHNGYRREERILRKRYARGEITETQFKRMMKTLHEKRQ